MKRILILLTLLFMLFSASAQDSMVVSPEARNEFRKVQNQLDLNHGGIGISLYEPSLGKITESGTWIDVNMLSDIIEIKFGLGKTAVRGNIPFGYGGSQYVKNKQFGYHFYTGVNFPVNLLTLGSQKTSTNVFRGHPVIAGGLGVFNMTNEQNYTSKRTAQIFYLGINPGYRIRVPFGSIEANLNARLGFSMGAESDYFKGVGFYPSITFRIDALKWKYNPNLVNIEGTMTTVSDVRSTTVWTGSRTVGSTTYDTYNTTTTGTVHVNPVNIGIQDIGPHFGIGPKISFMSPKRSPYIPLSKLYGMVFEGRGGPLDFGFTVEGGRVGHGGELEIRDKAEHKYHRKLDRGTTTGQGEISTINTYMQLGFDISPLFLIPFGITYDKGEATSFLSVTTGLNFGAHFSFGQRFLDETTSRADYDAKLADNAGEAKEKFIDPAAAKSGYLSGFYISVQIGAMNFKVTNYRYYGAPFASTSMFSLAYRIPLTRR